MANLIYKGLKANLPVTREANSFYLCTDTRELFFGDSLYTEPVRFYTGTKPTSPAQGVLYVDTATGSGDVWNGSAWTNVVKPTSTAIADSADDTTVPTSKAVKDYVDAKTAGIATDESLEALNNKVTTLIGSDTGKSARTIANEELAAQLIPENAKEALDTLAEIAAWIQEHPDDASAMNTAITALQNLVGTLPDDATSTTVVAYIKEYADAAIAALNIGDYAKAADLTAAVTRITAAEGKLDILNGTDTVDGSVAKALKDAKAYTDEKNTAMDTRVNAVEDKAHEHTNKTELDKFEDGDKDNLDAVVEALTVGTF